MRWTDWPRHAELLLILSLNFNLTFSPIRPYSREKRIRNGFRFTWQILRAISLRPRPRTSHHMLRRHEYGLFLFVICYNIHFRTSKSLLLLIKYFPRWNQGRVGKCVITTITTRFTPRHCGYHRRRKRFDWRRFECRIWHIEGATQWQWLRSTYKNVNIWSLIGNGKRFLMAEPFATIAGSIFSQIYFNVAEIARFFFLISIKFIVFKPFTNNSRSIAVAHMWRCRCVLWILVSFFPRSFPTFA